jgi:hypothetical protein
MPEVIEKGAGEAGHAEGMQKKTTPVEQANEV